MKQLKKYAFLLLMTMFLFSCTTQVHAYTGFKTSGSVIQYYTKEGKLLKGHWFKYNNNFYYAKSNGNIATGFTRIGGKLYYFTKTGVSKTGWIKINGKNYYAMKKTRDIIVNKKYKFLNGKTYYFNETGVMQKGWKKINGKHYYFNPEMKTGWLVINNKKYYLIKAENREGQRAEGIFSIGGKIYFFDPNSGVLQTDKTVTVNGRKYKIDKNGVCSVSSMTSAPSAKMLFFLTFESGSEAYDQTGGDHGCACGAYQFDYRYSLLPFVKYAYRKNSTLCAEFKKYVSLSSGTSLKSNSKFYKAWHAVYKRDKKAFSAIQDTYARVNYYDNVEMSLQNAGIDIASRPDVVKGAIFSYSIQHGQTSAVNAVKAVKLNSSMSNKTFLNKLYAYRIKQFPAYKTRYTAEYNLALTKL